jgi:sarcosine oxidase
MPAIDVVVVGLGAMGSAALCHLAHRGKRVLGVERFTPGHDRGSSHGLTRLIRLGYFEHPSYVPLLRRAYALWRELEAAAGRRLLHVTGIVEIGRPDSRLVAGTLAAARQHDLLHEILDAGHVMQRYHAFRLPADYVGVVQSDGGFVLAEPSVEAHLALARAAGAELRTGETVRAVASRADGVRVVTERATIDAGAAIIAAGPWMKQLVPGIASRLRVTRNVHGWFAPPDAARTVPVFLIETPHGIHYGIPPHGGAGMKIAKHHHRDEEVDPEGYDSSVSAADVDAIRAMIAEFASTPKRPTATSSSIACRTRRTSSWPRPAPATASSSPR